MLSAGLRISSSPAGLSARIVCRPFDVVYPLLDDFHERRLYLVDNGRETPSSVVFS
jgi:hypothetical protein